jgi:hypothetical protein
MVYVTIKSFMDINNLAVDALKIKAIKRYG